MIERRCASACAVVVVLLGCGRPAVTTEPQRLRERLIAASETNPVELVIPGEAVGEVRLGMTRKQIRRLLGRPDRTSLGAWEYLTRGYAIAFDSDRVSTVFVGSGLCGDEGRLLARAFRGRTAENIHMMSSRAEIEAAYGVAAATRKVSEVLLEMRYPKRGMTFLLEKDGLVWFALTKPRPAGG